MSEENTRLMVRKSDPISLNVSLESRAYARLVREARISSPRATAGALIGTIRQSRDIDWIKVVDIEPLDLVLSDGGQTVDPNRWTQLEAELSQAKNPSRSIVGWYYIDPEIGTRQPAIDMAAIQQAFAPTNLFLMVNPSSEKIALYIWHRHDDNSVRMDGFYEKLPSKKAAPIIPWNGKIEEALEWVRPRAKSTTGAAQAQGENAPPIHDPPQNIRGLDDFDDMDVPNLSGSSYDQPDYVVNKPIESAAPLENSTPELKPYEGESIGELMDMAQRLELQENYANALEIYQKIRDRMPHETYAAKKLELIIRELKIKQNPQKHKTDEDEEVEIDILFDTALAEWENHNWLNAWELLSEVLWREPYYDRYGKQAAELKADVEQRLYWGQRMRPVKRGILAIVSTLAVLMVFAFAITAVPGSQHLESAAAPTATRIVEVLSLEGGTVQPGVVVSATAHGEQAPAQPLAGTPTQVIPPTATAAAVTTPTESSANPQTEGRVGANAAALFPKVATKQRLTGAEATLR